jgi:hypothetical protein
MRVATSMNSIRFLSSKKSIVDQFLFGDLGAFFRDRRTLYKGLLFGEGLTISLAYFLCSSLSSQRYLTFW